MNPSRFIIPVAILYLGVTLLTLQSHRHSAQVIEKELDGKIFTMVAAARIVLAQAPANPRLFRPDNEAALERLYDLEQAFSLENISLLDMLYRVVNSTNPLFNSDDEAFVAVTPEEKQRLLSGQTIIRPLADLGGSFFKTVIFPLPGARETGAVMMDVNLDYLDALRQLRQRFYYGYAASGLIFLAAVLLTLVILKQLKTSLVEKEKNEKLAIMGKMSASIAHEIKNPLGIIKSAAQVLERKLGDAGGESLAYIHEEIDRLNRNIDDYLSFARDITVSPRPIDARSLIAGVLKDFPDAIMTEGDLGTIFYDPDRLIQVLRNLLLNARQHGGGKAAVSAGRSGNQAFIRVCDSGPGIPEAHLETIFDPFHTTSSGGTGLGLNICRKIVELHGGTITAENKSGGGSCFTITIRE